jgi:hypothetical protein
MDWLTRNALFKERLQGEIPQIDAEKAKARLFERIQQLPATGSTSFKSLQKIQYTHANNRKPQLTCISGVKLCLPAKIAYTAGQFLESNSDT